MQMRLIVLSNDARGARSLKLTARKLAIAALAALSALAGTLWLGWKISEFAARS